MADIAASVLARLKNKAAESGRSYQLCLQLFCPQDQYRDERLQHRQQMDIGGMYQKIMVSFI